MRPWNEEESSLVASLLDSMSDQILDIREQARKAERVRLRVKHLEWHAVQESNPSDDCHTCVLLDEPDSK